MLQAIILVLQPTEWFVTAWQGGVLLSLRQGWEVITSVFGNKLAQFIRCDDLDIVAPLLKVPCHFKPPTGFEADDEPALRVSLHDLIGMKHIVFGFNRCPFIEPPNHAAKFFV